MILTPQDARKLDRRCGTIYGHHRRRARDNGHLAGLPYTLEDLRFWVRTAVEGGGCAYCGCPLTPTLFQLDHRQPIARGGGWGSANLCVACTRCNQAKGEFTAAEFVSLLALADTWAPRGRDVLLARLRAAWRVYQ